MLCLDYGVLWNPENQVGIESRSGDEAILILRHYTSAGGSIVFWDKTERQVHEK